MKGLTTLRRKALMAINAKPMTAAELAAALEIEMCNKRSAARALLWANQKGFARLGFAPSSSKSGPRPFLFSITSEGEHVIRLMERGEA